MTRAWETLDSVGDGARRLELRRRGSDFLLLEGGRVLMNSHADRSERLLAERACERLAMPAPRVLIAGLGMGITLREALRLLPPAARVVVAEREPAIVEWCRGPLREVAGAALDDARVEVRGEDVARTLERAAASGPPLDAVLLDLSEGPAPSGIGDHPVYGRDALARTAHALTPEGVLAVWSEQPSRAFERFLRAAGMRFERVRAEGGRRHTVYLAASVDAGGRRALP